MVLSKVVTTIGKPGVAVASITKRHQGHVLAHVEGPDRPLLNGTPMGESPVPLKHGDRITLAGTEMQFEQG
ncbi:MAG: FHA protein [uncultured bacterium]|nr:MAG: FHA protein [uncultured bacterium]